MRFMCPARASHFCVVLAIALLAIAAPARTGRDFSGYFNVSGVHEQGNLVQVTLHLKLFNHSDSDARSVVVALADSGPSFSVRGSFQPVRVWKSQRFLELSQEFTITQRQFQEWMRPPAQPDLVILYQDSHGRTWQQGAQLSRRPF